MSRPAAPVCSGLWVGGAGAGAATEPQTAKGMTHFWKCDCLRTKNVISKGSHIKQDFLIKVSY